jgi:hypothetical protein
LVVLLVLLAIPVALLDIRLGKQDLLAHRDLPVLLASLVCLVCLVFRVFLV